MDHYSTGGVDHFSVVVDTWRQNLSQHIHLHCLIPGGALSKKHWCEIKKGYLYPVKALSTVFKAKMLTALHEHGVSETPTPNKWCVYSKACLSYSEKLVSYLARYTRKGVMSESRLVSVSDKTVRFKYCDYADKHRSKVMTLSCDEFLRRYLQHILPKGFMRIRHYGFLANASRKKSLGLIRAQKTQPRQAKSTVQEKPRLLSQWPCQQCKTGILTFTGIISSALKGLKVERTI